MSKNEYKKADGCIRFFLYFMLVFFLLPPLMLAFVSTGQTIMTWNWEKVEAQIDTVYMTSRKFSKTTRTGNNKRTKRKTYWASKTQTSYTYQWQGQTYQSDRIAFWQNYNKKAKREALNKKITQGQKLIAFVNPKSPTEATLVRNIHNQILFFWVSFFSTALFLLC